MLCKRVIACLDVEGSRVVKGTSFERLRDVGDPVQLAERYEAEGADEIVYLDISASPEGRRTLLEVVRRTAERLFIPLSVGGGIQQLDDVERALRAGADKVCVNTAAVQNPDLVRRAADRYGAQCIIVSIDARHHAVGPGVTGGDYRVYTHGGRRITDLDAIGWASKCAADGAGEILITSIDQDGRRTGFDLNLTAQVSRAVSVPVIASGGAGSPEHFSEVFDTGASAALAAGIFHDESTSIGEVKHALSRAGIPVRLPPDRPALAAREGS